MLQGGGGVNLQRNSYLGLTNCLFHNNSAPGPLGTGGAVEAAIGIMVEVTNTSFLYNTAGGTGGGLYVSDNATTNIEGAHFMGNIAKVGGGFSIGGNGSLADCTFESNSALQAGAVDVSLSVKLNISRTKFIGNIANTGAALNVDPDGKVCIRECEFHAHVGTALYVADRSSIYMRDSNMSGNSGGTGGAFCILFSSTFVSENCSFWNNTAQDGGAGYVNGISSARLNNCYFWLNKAQYGHGGALYVNGVSNISVSGTNFTRNTAEKGAAIYVLTADTVFFDSIKCVANNAASSWGGCLCIDGSIFTFQRSEITNNVAGQGAAIRMSNCRAQVRS